ncbi:MAG: acetyl-CoA carboxylase biotin carboxyl carrier protein [Clostridiales bacterium]|jgi:acetyl-CoA carboxylase biotin carboxyl carrier protein|nr:acetyl-CoA carboxylase biotin carboxyl carrier protein [Clostridiales bacterium]
MDFNQVKELVRMIDASTITDFNIEFENTKINMSKDSTVKISDRPAAAQSAFSAPESVAADFPAEPAEPIAEPITILPASKPVQLNGNTVDSPLVGTFYESAGPGEPPFVTVGAKVKKGDVLCIVEAMKIMNEITSKYDGTVSEILVNNEDMVEYGQHLYVIA